MRIDSCQGTWINCPKLFRSAISDPAGSRNCLWADTSQKRHQENVNRLTWIVCFLFSFKVDQERCINSTMVGSKGISQSVDPLGHNLSPSKEFWPSQTWTHFTRHQSSWLKWIIWRNQWMRPVFTGGCLEVLKFRFNLHRGCAVFPRYFWGQGGGFKPLNAPEFSIISEYSKIGMSRLQQWKSGSPTDIICLVMLLMEKMPNNQRLDV